MADLDLESFETADLTSEVMNRPNPRYAVTGQADFLGLALLQRIPIVAANRSLDLTEGPALSGRGVSAAVTRFDSAIQTRFDQDFVNPPRDNWFALQTTGNLRQAELQYVTKKIVASSRGSCSDAQQLACIVNEIRILSNRTLRKSRHIVNLLAISWFEQSVGERHWPQLLIELAEHGTLKNYLNLKTLTPDEKCALSLDILSGLDFLHRHGISHCDLKPANILIFKEPMVEGEMDSDERSGVVAKLCDFGYAVIHSDYPPEAPFQSRMGSFPWASPELEYIPNGLPIPLTALHSTDIYSFGLVYASILMNGTTPFRGLSADQVISLKLEDTIGETAYKHVESEVKAATQLISIQQSFVSLTLAQTLQPRAEQRSSIPSLISLVKMETSTTAIEDEMSQNSRIFDNSNQQQLSGQKTHDTGHFKASDANPKTITSLQDRTVGTQDHTNLLHKVILVESLFEPDPIPAIENFKTLKNSILRSAQATAVVTTAAAEDDEHVDSIDENSSIETSSRSEKKLKTLPDLCFEYGYVGGALPRVAAQEIIRDLELQITNGDCRGDILYEVSGAYFNGCITQRSLTKGLEIFHRAVETLYPPAVMSLYNVYESCQQSPPDKLQKIFTTWIEKNKTSNLGVAIGKALSLSVPWRIDYNRISVEAYARLDPHKYAAVKALFNPEMRIHLLREVYDTKNYEKSFTSCSSPFDFDSLPSLRGKEMLRSSQIDYTEFIQDVRRLNCLECYNENNFTLLQEAVSHANTDMVDLLVNEMGADIDNYGNTPGWTPLWLACFSGQADLAVQLIQKGAAKNCHDLRTGYGILHLINRFSSYDEIDRIVTILSIDNQDFDINEACKDKFAPLHTTFLDFDFSDGCAARCLLDHGADPTKAALDMEKGLTPIDLCILRLDHALLKAMISCKFLSRHSPDGEIRRKITKVKEHAFRILLTFTEFQLRSSVGRDWYTALQRVLEQLVDDDMQRLLAGDHPTDKGFKILEGAIGRSRSHIAQAILDLDLASVNPPVSCPPLLHFAIERRMDDITFALIAKGADFLRRDEHGQHALHMAAHHHSAILEPLINKFESLSEDERRGNLIKQVLELHTNEGFDVISLLLVEGSQAEVILTERLRRRFGLDLDAMVLSDIEDQMTLAGVLIAISNLGGLIPLTQINYLFGLDPPLRFVCSKSGHTLLHFAVMGQMSYQTSMDYVGHQICKLVLERYGTLENILTRTETGSYATHYAAAWANRVALDMIQSHLISYMRRHPSQQQMTFDEVLNLTDHRGETALDQVAKSLMDSDENDATSYSPLNTRLRSDRRPAAKDCYVLLRESGAVHSEELSGLRLASRMMYTKLTNGDDGWLRFLAYLSRKTGLSNLLFEETLVMQHDDQDAETAAQLQDEPLLEGAICDFQVVELVWRLDDFALRTFQFQCSPLILDKHVQDLSEIRDNDANLYRQYLNVTPDQGVWPWSITSYRQMIPIQGRPVLGWTRRGKIWAEEEVTRLREAFAEVWTEIYGDLEKHIFSGDSSGTPVVLAIRA